LRADLTKVPLITAPQLGVYVLQVSSLALPRDLTKTHLYHITDISNLPSILANGGLLSDCALAVWHTR